MTKLQMAHEVAQALHAKTYPLADDHHEVVRLRKFSHDYLTYLWDQAVTINNRNIASAAAERNLASGATKEGPA